MSSLEERQKECRLYVDRIGDILLSHIPNMGVYMVCRFSMDYLLIYIPIFLLQEYCVNQSTAIQVLKSLRDSNPELASHLKVSSSISEFSTYTNHV